ncbi:MAG: MBL fold metallo-hydrolase [Leptospira sp.]|nr:MBL fold metallo-hydrolase [Leptospira sp.]
MKERNFKIKLLLGVIGLFTFITFYLLGYPKLKIEMNQTENKFVQTVPKTDISFSIIKTGEAKTSEAFVFEGGNVFNVHTISHSAILIKHPSGMVLFDTGLGKKIDEQFKEFPWFLKLLLSYEIEDNAVDKLVANGIMPDQIKTIFISHLHWDHASAIKDFPKAEIVTLKEELSETSILKGYVPSQFDGEAVKWNYIKLNPIQYESYTESTDWFGDGSIVLVNMKGHSAGSLGLFLNLKDGRRYFFTGDVTWDLRGFQSLSHKPRGARLLVDYDPMSVGKEISRVNQLMEKDKTLKVVPAHDLNVQGEIGFFPKWN